MKTSDLKSFFYLEDGTIQFSNLETEKVGKVIDKGFYTLDYDGFKNSVILKRLENTETSKIHNFENKEILDNLFDKFYNKSCCKKIQELGFYHKVGILLYGKEGCGKTTIFKHYCTKAVENEDAIVFNIIGSPSGLTKMWDLIKSIRSIQDNPIIVVFDEFDYMASSNFGQESNLKKIIDGDLSIHNVVFMASTNYIERIPKALSDRPSRFKYKIEIGGMTDVNDIRIIVHNLLSDYLKDDEIDKLSEELVGNTIDQIKHKCLDNILDLSSNIKEKRIGFKVA